MCRTTARCGGSQTVITIVSRKPTRPIPVKAAIVSPSAATALGPGEQHPAVVDVPVGEHVPDPLDRRGDLLDHDQLGHRVSPRVAAQPGRRAR